MMKILFSVLLPTVFFINIFILPTTVHAAEIGALNEVFDNYENGNVVGQGGWSGSSLNNPDPWVVIDESLCFSGKCLASNAQYTSTGIDLATSTNKLLLEWQIRMPPESSGFMQVYFDSYGSEIIGYLRFNATANDFYISVPNGDTIASGLALDTWHHVSVELHRADSVEGCVMFVSIDNGEVIKTDFAESSQFCTLISLAHQDHDQFTRVILDNEIQPADSRVYIDNLFATSFKEDGPECCSSVLFLPGIMGTELYENGEKRWEPSGESDVERLYLDENGNSVNSVTTGEVIKTFDGPLDIDIYKSFLADLEEASSTGLISSYAAYAYDWRLSLENILADDRLANELRSLAQNSKSGKVTIVAHSNGGLLTKALINQIEDQAAGPEDGAASLIDKIVFVGVPQLGTPQAIGALLHGFDSGIPLRYPEERARDFAQNAPFGYNLLPHYDYYETISTPLISFDDGEATQSFINEYGYGVTNATELENFLLGTDGRTTPAYNDLVNPSRANGFLLNQGDDEYSAIDSDWLLPAGIEFHQIAGVGELTVAGIKYGAVKECLGAQLYDDGLWRCDYTGQNKLAYKPIRVLDGDSTVIEPSALAVSTDNENVKRWWVDLDKYNSEHPTLSWFEKEHKNILEIPDVSLLIINNFLATSTSYNYAYISDSKPDFGSKDRLSFTLHSPLSLSYTENDGMVVDADNPYGNYSQYTRYGEVQIIDIFDEEGQGNIIMNGESTGSFTLEIEEASGNEVISTATYSGIPSSTSTVATIEVSGGTITDTAELTVDYEGDGTTDFTLEPSAGEEVSLPPEPTVEEDPTFAELITELKDYINTHVTKKSIKRILINQLNNLQRQHDRIESLKAKNPQFAHFFNAKILETQIRVLEKQVDLYSRLKRIDNDVAEEIKRLLELIRESL